MFETNTRESARRMASSIAGVTLIGTLSLVPHVAAQSNGRWQPAATLNTGTTIEVRTSNAIDTSTGDGQVFTAFVDRDVMDSRGVLAIPSGATVELVVRSTADSDLVLDLDSVMVNGQRYGVRATSATVGTTGSENGGLGKNKETVQHVGGGALLGTIIGAIAGGAKGAAVGAAVGAGAGAGVQVLTHGKRVTVPAETLLTYRLQNELNLGVNDTGYTRDGRHYHNYDH